MTTPPTDRIRNLPTATLGKAPKADKRRVVRWWKAAK